MTFIVIHSVIALITNAKYEMHSVELLDSRVDENHDFNFKKSDIFD